MIWFMLALDGTADAEMLERCIRLTAFGDRSAFEKLYELCADAVYGYALSMLKNTHDAEDVLHDCFVKVYCGAEGYISQGKPMAWIFTIARNLCNSRFRDASRTADLPPEDWDSCIGGREDTTAEDRLLIEACMEKLSADEREIFLLHALSELKYREIAELTGRPLSTVLSKYHRALKKMRDCLEEDGDET